MYARVTQFQIDPSREAEVIATFDAVSSQVKALPGVISAFTSWRSEDGHGVTAALYESKRPQRRLRVRSRASGLSSAGL